MSTIADTGQLMPAAKCFRLRRYYLYLGIVCAVFFVAMGVASSVAAFLNIDGSFAQPKLAALIFATFWSGMTLLAIWIIAAYLRERLLLSKTAIVDHGIFRSKTIELERALRIKWRTWPVGGRVVVRSQFDKITIPFQNFTIGERQELIHFLRDAFAAEIQENWLRFEEEFLRPLPTKRASRSEIIAIATILLCFACVFAYLWIAGFGPQYLLISVVNVVAAIMRLWWMRFAKDGSKSNPA